MNWNNNISWRPTAEINALRFRAEIMSKIRHFFSLRQVLEVETPLLGLSTATDPHLSSFITNYGNNVSQASQLFLQTSPEFPMKRLLSAGSGAIYQICKAFRNGEMGKRHNPEFTLLEWYRPDFDHHMLMDEMDDLLNCILKCEKADRISYAELFLHYLEIHPHRCGLNDLLDCVNKHHIHFSATPEEINKDFLFDLLLTHLIEPKLGLEKPLFVYDYPASQAALARIRCDEDYPVGERFEVYYRTIELANGYHELSDAEEQHKRFVADNATRLSRSLPVLPIDEKLLAALHTHFPSCAGVALGIDRLIMLAFRTEQIDDIISFTFDGL